MNRRHLIVGGAAAAAWGGLAWRVTRSNSGGPSLLNASYDATRELYRILNRMFMEKSGIAVRPSHGGSGKQALAVREGLPADVVSLAVWPDLNELRKAQLLDDGWEERFPNHSLPYTSTIVFVVRKGNPHAIGDWPDLVTRDGLRVIAANPKTGGAAKLAVLACWGAVKHVTGSEQQADNTLLQLFNPRRIPILEGSSRTATQTFARKQIGDVHLTWESEALLEMRELADDVEIIRPPVSILAEPHVAVVDANARRHGTLKSAHEYLHFLYERPSQEVIASLGFRAADAAVLAASPQFPAMERLSIKQIVAGGWSEAQARFFADGALFDRAYV